MCCLFCEARPSAVAGVVAHWALAFFLASFVTVLAFEVLLAAELHLAAVSKLFEREKDQEAAFGGKTDNPQQVLYAWGR